MNYKQKECSTKHAHSEATFTVQKQNKGPSQHLLNGSGKLDKNLIEMGVIDPEAEVHYLLQAY